LKGAAYFTVDLSRKMVTYHSLYFLETSSYKNGQTQSKDLILPLINPDKFVGRKVVLVDELCDNGKTMELVKQSILKNTQVKNCDILTCVAFKKEKERVYPEPDIFGAALPDVWLVGHGLDDRQEKRNLTQLYGVPKSECVKKTIDDIIFYNENIYNNMLQCLLYDF
jgi:hypoxanthine phosphoribosyltransferase